MGEWSLGVSKLAEVQYRSGHEPRALVRDKGMLIPTHQLYRASAVGSHRLECKRHGPSDQAQERRAGCAGHGHGQGPKGWGVPRPGTCVTWGQVSGECRFLLGSPMPALGCGPVWSQSQEGSGFSGEA